MKKFIVIFISLLIGQSAIADETIVLIRHAEKPVEGIGQLTCQGLNRSLRLPDVLISKFGYPETIYAPNPSMLKNDRGTDYYYIRPLATIEPTAIRLAMPVNIKYSFADSDGISEELLSSKYQNSIIFLAWEHHLAAKIAETILSETNGSSEHLKWDDSDFDSIYVIKIHDRKATLTVDKQGLNNQPKVCK